MVRDPDTEPDVLTWDDCLQKAALSLDLASKTPLPSPHLGVAEAWLRLAALIKEPK
jgi:hypothetical protein